MDSKKMIAIVAVIIIVIAAAAAVALTRDNGGNGGDSTDEMITVTDGLGRTVTLSNIETVSSCSNVVASILCGIGASSSIVAVSVDDGAYEDFSSVIGLVDDDYPQGDHRWTG